VPACFQFLQNAQRHFDFIAVLFSVSLAMIQASVRPDSHDRSDWSTRFMRLSTCSICSCRRTIALQPHSEPLQPHAAIVFAFKLVGAIQSSSLGASADCVRLSVSAASLRRRRAIAPESSQRSALNLTGPLFHDFKLRFRPALKLLLNSTTFFNGCFVANSIRDDCSRACSITWARSCATVAPVASSSGGMLR